MGTGSAGCERREVQTPVPSPQKIKQKVQDGRHIWPCYKRQPETNQLAMEAIFSHQKSTKHTLTATSTDKRRNLLKYPNKRRQTSEFGELVESFGFEALHDKACEFYFHRFIIAKYNQLSASCIYTRQLKWLRRLVFSASVQTHLTSSVLVIWCLSRLTYFP